MCIVADKTMSKTKKLLIKTRLYRIFCCNFIGYLLIPEKIRLKYTSKLFLDCVEIFLNDLHVKKNYWTETDVDEIENNYQKVLIKWHEAKTSKDYLEIKEMFTESFVMLMLLS